MNWIKIDLDHEPFDGPSDVFARSSTTFTADSLGKTTSAGDKARQAFFHAQLARLSAALGSVDLPVFIAFRGERRRMDKGCVGHAVAAGVLEPPRDGAAGYVDTVRLRSRTGQARPTALS